MNDPFAGVATLNSNWLLPQTPTEANVACLTAGTSTAGTPVPDCSSPEIDSPGSGALRLTGDVGGEEGALVHGLSVPTVAGLDAIFDVYQYGDAPGADGVGFFLAAANPTDPTPPAEIGQPGGTLGYSGFGANTGMQYGYLDVGLDVFGNYANTTFEGSGCTDPGWDSAHAFPDNVSVRGPGNGTVGYCMLQSTAVDGLSSGSLDGGPGGTRSTSTVPAEVAINPGASSVTTASGLDVPADSFEAAFTPIGGSAQTFGGSLPSVSGLGFPPSWYDATTGIPYQLTFGWAGSTGGEKEIHEITNAIVTTLDGTAATLTMSVTDSASGAPSLESTFDYGVTVGDQS